LSSSSSFQVVKLFFDSPVHRGFVLAKHAAGREVRNAPRSTGEVRWAKQGRAEVVARGAASDKTTMMLVADETVDRIQL